MKMKLFAILLVFSVAAASFEEKLDDAADEFLLDFLEGMGRAPTMRDHFGEVNSEYLDLAEDEIKSQIGEQLKQALNDILKKLKDAIEEREVIQEEFLEKVKGLRELMKELTIELGDKGKDLLERIKEKANDFYKRFQERLGTQKRSAEDAVEQALSELNIKDLLRKVKEHLKKTVDPQLAKDILEKIFGQGSELLDQLLQTLKEKGRKKMEMLIDLLIDEDGDREARGISDYWDKVKNYFKDLKIDLQEKYLKFGEWVKESLGKGFEHSKDKMENIKAIATEFARHAKGISKEVAIEAGEFFKNYKEELGNVWVEIKERINEARNRKD